MDEAERMKLRHHSLAVYGTAYEYRVPGGPYAASGAEDIWYPLDPASLRIIVGSVEKPGGAYRDIHLRKTSRAKEGKLPFPFDSPLVPFVFIFPDQIVQATKPGAKIDYLLLAKRPENAGTIVLAPWPGKERQDCFVLDDIDEALAALGHCEPQQEASQDTAVRGPGDALSGESPGPAVGGGVQSQDAPAVDERLPQP
jgi:hypothetical protein